jgi:hypothetical protein
LKARLKDLAAKVSQVYLCDSMIEAAILLFGIAALFKEAASLLHALPIISSKKT